MALLAHHRGARDGQPTRSGTIVKALLTLLFVTAVVAGFAGLAAYAASRVVVSLLS